MSNLDKAVGDVSTARTLFQPRMINGVSFDGSADVVAPTLGVWSPAAYGYIAWAFDIGSAYSSTGLLGGYEWCIGLRVPACTITNIHISIETAGSGLTSGQNLVTLYQGSTLKASSANQSTAFTSTGVLTIPLSSPQVVTAGQVCVGVLSNGTTPPKLHNGLASAIGNTGLSSPNLRNSFAGGGAITAPPSPLGTQTGHGTSFWAAVS